ncbi:MAG: hypothetical protein ACYC1Z_14040 [Georgenia sp.]
MIKRFLAIVLLATPALAGAQSVTATATVLPTVSNAITNMNFGNVTPGTAVTLAADATPSSPQQAGLVALTFNTSTATVAIPASVTMSRTGGGTMVANLACGSAPTVGGTVTAQTAAACQAGVAFSYNGNNSALATGALYIGGSIAASQSQFARAGVYTGSFPVTITNTAN